MGKQAFLSGSTLLLCSLAFLVSPAGAKNIEAVEVGQAPVLDGSGGDAAWGQAKAVTVKDRRSGDDIVLKAVRSGDMVYFLAQFPDKEENRLHKPWVWNKEMSVYALGPQREDGFTFKWSMAGREVDLSNFSDDSYRADVWYWKANRTDPAGYSDDKNHVLSPESGKKARALTSASGKQMFLVRNGDAGQSAQKKVILTDYQGDVKDQYVSRTPDGSRADVRAKGVWKDGAWTVEFGRKLDTGNADDVRFDPSSKGKYLFGVSIYGLYGENVDDSKAHLYGQGRISEKLFLSFP